MSGDNTVVDVIQLMMYRFGDWYPPILESAKLIEDILIQQIRSLLLQCVDVATTLRKSSTIGHEDILFIMRKNKVKLKRLLKYLEVKDMQGILKKVSNSCETLSLKRVQACLDFLATIDQTGELSSLMSTTIVDEASLKRAARLDHMTKFMDQEQYLTEYEKARRAAFCSRQYHQVFSKWLQKNCPIQLKTTALAHEMVLYLAREVVAEVVDLALIIKQESLTDPLQQLQAESVLGSKQSVIHEMFDTSSFNNTDIKNGSIPSSTSLSSPLLRNSASLPEKRHSSYNFKVKQHKYSENCIQPEDIREAIQRYLRPSGPFTLFSKSCESNMQYCLLIC